MATKIFFKKPLYLIFSASVISIILIILLNYTIKLENKLEEKMLDISTNDIISILQALKSSGSIDAEIKTM